MTRLNGFRGKLVEGEEAWRLNVLGMGQRLRTVMALDKIKHPSDQHHLNMGAADLYLDAQVDRVSASNNLPTTAIGARMAAQSRSRRRTPGGWEEGGRHCRTRCGRNAWRTLVRILKRPTLRWDLDQLVELLLDHQPPSQTDRNGAWERSAIYKALSSLLREVAAVASTHDLEPGSADLLRASTHWLRHFRQQRRHAGAAPGAAGPAGSL